MKKYLSVLLVVCVCGLLGVSQAATIDAISIVQAQGVSADYVYDAVDGTITWSGGAVGSVISTNFNFDVTFHVDVTGNFSNMTDMSASPLARASFGTGDFSVALKAGVDHDDNPLTDDILLPYLTISGELSGSSYEEGELVDGLYLDGLAITEVDVDLQVGYFLGKWAGLDDVVWGGEAENCIAGITTSVLLPSSLSTYLDPAGYQSDNLSLTIHADESTVPEPATLAILGLGSLLALRRRRG